MLKNLIIKDNLTIKEALKKVEESGHKTVYVEKKNRLVGSLSDGDIRKLIINNVSLDKKITKIYNNKPKFLEKKKFTISNAKKILLKYKIDSLVITNKNKIIDVVTLRDLYKNKKK